MSLDELRSLLIAVVLSIVLAALGLLATRFFRRWAKRVIRSAENLHGERQQQLDTFVQIFHWAANILIIIAALLMVLSAFDINIAPLLTSVGVAGLAVSLGAQTLIKDLIGGLLILVENQYTVGDFIQVQDVEGTVEQLTLRATYLRDQNGNLHVVPNGEVRIVSNRTKDWSRAVVDVGVAYEEDLDRVLRVLEDLVEDSGPEFGSQLLEPPQVVGPIGLGDWAVTVRVTARTRPGKQWEIARELRKRILVACERENITLPYPRQEIMIREGASFSPESRG
jgi:small-conductance mechanosensitive channel